MQEGRSATRWLYPHELERARKAAVLDPVREGARYGFDAALSRALWLRACGETSDGGRLDAGRAQHVFHALARRLAARGVRRLPEVGKQTRVGSDDDAKAERDGGPARELIARTPGRETRIAREPDEGEVAPSPRSEAPAEPIQPSVGIELSRLFGVDLTRLPIVPNSPKATGATQAVTQHGEVHFRAGAYQPGTRRGNWLIAHEVAHVVQQRAGGAARAGSRQEIEREADRAANLVVRGQPAQITLRAQPSTAYAFSDGEAHDTDGDEHASAATSAEHAPAGAEHAPAVAEHAPQPAAPAHEDAHDDHISSAELAEVSAPIPGESVPAGSAKGGGGPAAKPDKPAPNVAAAKPEAGLSQMHGVRPDRLSQLFGQLHGANAADVGKARAAEHANPPKQMSTGAAVAPAAKPGAPPQPANANSNANAADKPMPTKPVKGEVPGGEADKQAKQKQATDQQQAKAAAVAEAKQRVQSVLDTLFNRHAPAPSSTSDDSKTQKMSDTESRNMASSIDKLPTTSADITADPGAAPKVDMQGDAKAQSTQERAKLEQQTAQLEATGRADAQTPMGEDHIDPTAAPESLTASFKGGEAPEAKLPTVAAAASSEEVGIVAQEQHGAEIDAALTKASGDVTAERTKHTAEQTAARAESDAQIQQLKSKADADQSAARASAQAEVHAARAQWQGEIDKKGADARKQADAKVADGMAQVTAEQTKANAEAQKHIADGQQKAEEEKQKGEKEAADAKDKAKEKSSGFFGWIASKARAAFDAVKKAVSSVIEACKKAVKAVIDAAKKLAMAAIELARKVIVAAIKAVGDALIAISNVVLAAFPALKAKFQAAIKGAVDKAVATVNKLADGLKKSVQKALDMLGAALDKAFSLLEKGINAIIDAANAVVQGAIKAAQAVVQALGTWAKLIKDIVTGPGSWLGKLGAAVMDGIRNHLWLAFKTAVVEWFKSKVFELLGVGGIILELLLEGGLTRENITQMAMDALMTAIPAALIAILLEKLVSMIVPAAGAVMAVIEGLQAAWGTVSRIIAAFSAFMAFLLAVKGGTAGPLFAGVLAAAAVVVLDFVANWLLKKLASAARKVGAKLKGMAEKFKAKRAAKKAAKADKHARKADEHARKPDEHARKPDDKHKSAEEQRKEEIQKRVEKAQRELPPKVNALLAKKPSRLRVLAQFAVWRMTYRLSKLELRGNQGKIDIFAQVNPTITLAPGWTFNDHDVFKALDEIGGEMLAAARKARPTPQRTASGQIDFTQRRHPAEPAAHLQPATAWTKKTDPATAPSPESQYLVGHTEDGSSLGYRHERVFGEVGRIRPMDDGSGSNYKWFASKLEGVNVGDALGKMVRNEPVPNMTKEQRDALSELYGLWMGGKEASHPKGTFGHQRDLTYSYMVGQLMQGGTSLKDGVAMHPSSFGGAQNGANRVTLEMHADEPLPPIGNKTKAEKKEQADRDERYRREKLTSETWFKQHEAALKAWFAQRMKIEQRIEAREPTIEDVKDFVRHQIKLYISTHPIPDE